MTHTDNLNQLALASNCIRKAIDALNKVNMPTDDAKYYAFEQKGYQMANYQKLFEYDETTAEQLKVIVDYGNEQPEISPVTVAWAIRYAIAVAAMGIRSERIEIENTLTK